MEAVEWSRWGRSCGHVWCRWFSASLAAAVATWATWISARVSRPSLIPHRTALYNRRKRLPCYNNICQDLGEKWTFFLLPFIFLLFEWMDGGMNFLTFNCVLCTFYWLNQFELNSTITDSLKGAVTICFSTYRVHCGAHPRTKMKWCSAPFHDSTPP